LAAATPCFRFCRSILFLALVAVFHFYATFGAYRVLGQYCFSKKRDPDRVIFLWAAQRIFARNKNGPR
jgi:hypothetical protein